MILVRSLGRAGVRSRTSTEGRLISSADDLYRRALPALERELRVGGGGEGVDFYTGTHRDGTAVFRPLRLRSIGVQMTRLVCDGTPLKDASKTIESMWLPAGPSSITLAGPHEAREAGEARGQAVEEEAWGDELGWEGAGYRVQDELGWEVDVEAEEEGPSALSVAAVKGPQNPNPGLDPNPGGGRRWGGMMEPALDPTEVRVEPGATREVGGDRLAGEVRAGVWSVSCWQAWDEWEEGEGEHEAEVDESAEGDECEEEAAVGGRAAAVGETRPSWPYRLSPPPLPRRVRSVPPVKRARQSTLVGFVGTRASQGKNDGPPANRDAEACTMRHETQEGDVENAALCSRQAGQALRDMGFAADVAEAALRRCGQNLSAALDLLI